MAASFVLCIETSSKFRSQIALGKIKNAGKPGVWATQNLGSKAGQGEQLCAAIAGLLRKKNTPLSAIQKIYVSSGPGSFTGIRIGMATALGMALTQNIPVVSIPTLPCLALGAFEVLEDEDLVYLPLIKAQKGQLSGLLMGFKGGKSHVLIPNTIATPQQWVNQIATSTSKKIVVFGEGFLNFREDFKTSLGTTKIRCKVFPETWKPHFAQAKTLADFDAKGENPADLAIHYPRPGHLEFSVV